jgi:ubiquinone/menaquinone biosynthesis C-methylase UbiE
MNYGYAPTEPDAPELSLSPADEPDRYSIQLYHHVAGAVDLSGAAVLEIGCGRGGGSSYISRYLRPASVLGVDFSPEAVAFCTRTHVSPGLSFRQGDAEALASENDSFDVVVNVESSHCYGSVPRFLAEACRVLKPGGHLLWADLRPPAQIEETRRQFEHAGFTRLRETVITPNVLRALDLVSDARRDTIRRLVPRFMAGTVQAFAGVRGTRVYESLRTGATQYLSSVLRKPPA